MWAGSGGSGGSRRFATIVQHTLFSARTRTMEWDADRDSEMLSSARFLVDVPQSRPGCEHFAEPPADLETANPYVVETETGFAFPRLLGVQKKAPSASSVPSKPAPAGPAPAGPASMQAPPAVCSVKEASARKKAANEKRIADREDAFRQQVLRDEMIKNKADKNAGDFKHGKTPVLVNNRFRVTGAKPMRGRR
jgi:hypothetical protein